ncbi:MFS transporter [Cupriavidus sp. D39]|uniref:MFS transporter n=1 Tax=Cupriavidus sp. D39 TaxID=2997877 RepID=UPI00226F10FB|nr:MFS transporter [Cupriavidus sp. D39]MCY0857822.1 MFS transporter [Cupriavidus sp. D39]
MNTSKALDLEAIIDQGGVTGLQIAIFLLCGLIAMIDGFDTQAIAFVAPQIISEWNVEPAAFGRVFGAGLLGGLVGALVLGAAGDRFGRKTTMLCAVLVFAVASLLTPFAESIGELTALRFVTGIGLGGALPAFISLTSEYAPKRLRSSLVGMMFCGFPLGAVVGGVASAALIPAFGWKGVFFAGGALPLLILPIFLVVSPESVRYLALRGDRDAIARILNRMNARGRWNGEIGFCSGVSRLPVSGLFRSGRAPTTLLLWISFFLSLLLTYFLINWIPIVARGYGFDIEQAVFAVSMLNFGAVAGCIVLGRLSDRYGAPVVIGAGYLAGALAIGAIGFVGWSPRLLYTAAFVAGALSIGAQMCTVALCAVYYDTSLRATGIGWAMGVGRIGAIVGPVLGGVLLGSGVTSGMLFLVAGATSAGAAVAVLLLGRFMRRQGHRKEDGRTDFHADGPSGSDFSSLASMTTLD